MKRTSLAAAGGVLALGLSSFLLPWDGVTFAPSAGTKLTKTFDGQVEFSLDSMRVLVNGEEQDVPMDEEPAGTGTYSIVVTDTFKALEEGRPTDLLRSFVEVSGTVESSDGDSSEGSLDDLEGKTVHFAWDADAGSYDVTYEGGEGEEEALSLLNPDMDYRPLLPRGEVKDGDEWEVGGNDILKILVPGTDLRNAAASGIEIDGKPIPQKVVELMDKFLEGSKATCKYAGTSEVEGVTLAEIPFKGKISGTSEIDPREFAAEEMDDFAGEALINLTINLDFEGTLLWDVKAGHFKSFVLEGNGGMDMHMTMNMPDFDMEVENDMSASLTIEQKATAEKAE